MYTVCAYLATFAHIFHTKKYRENPGNCRDNQTWLAQGRLGLKCLKTALDSTTTKNCTHEITHINLLSICGSYFKTNKCFVGKQKSIARPKPHWAKSSPLSLFPVTWAQVVEFVTRPSSPRPIRPPEGLLIQPICFEQLFVYNHPLMILISVLNSLNMILTNKCQIIQLL